MMDVETDRWRRVETLFHAALDVVDSERRTYVESRAGGDATLTREVLALVDAHTRTHSLLDSPAVTDLPAGMRLGPYALERVLGSGGMATVYLARRADRQFEKQVAVKLVNRGLTAEIVGDRFKTERQILARLEHPHIARLLDAGLSEFGQPYLVMEWVDGVTLDEWVARECPSVDRRFDLWLDVVAAVGYAHQNLIIHRDLKPSNVLVGNDGVVKLLDFGIAKLVADQNEGSEATQTVHFTPLYASPEQIRGQPVTTATDVYALGLLLYELMLGVHPFRREGKSAHDLVQLALVEDVSIAADTPADLAAILRMALRKEPERRYPTAAAFADDVSRYRRGLPVIAQPETVAYRARKFIGRHRFAVAAAATVVVSLLSLTGLALWQAHVASQQRARAEQVTSFITGFLGATPTGPDFALQNKGVALRVVELADLIAERLGTNANLQPEAEQTLRAVLAMTYFQMGELEKSQHNALRAIDMCDRLYGPSDPCRFSAELVQAAVENNLGRFAEAEARVSRIAATWPSPSPTDQASLAIQLGLAELRLGKPDLAERRIRESIARVEAELGVGHPSVALPASYLGLVHLERGEFDQAVIQLERSAAISRRTMKDTSMPLAWALVNLANAYRFLGKNEELLRTAEESYAQFKGALGEGHFSMVHALAFIAHAKAIRGDDDAEAFARRSVAVQAQLPLDHHERAVGLTSLGFVLMQKHRLGEARAALDRALELRRKAFKAPNMRIAETAGWLGEVLAMQGNRQAARPLLEESLDTFTTLYGADNPRTRDARQRRDRYAVVASAGVEQGKHE